MVFSACPRHSTSGSIGFECSINIAYNKQVPVCRGEGPTYRVDETMQGDLTCRGWGGLCLADEGFEFSFDPSDEVSRKLVTRN